MQLKFRHRTIKWWAIKISILFLILGAFCFLLFGLEYTGRLSNFVSNHPSFSFLLEAPKILDLFYLPYQLYNSSLPVYDVVISDKKFNKIEQDLAKNSSDVLLDENRREARADLWHNNKKYEIKIQVHGDYGNHWKNIKKSWQITFEGDVLFNGKKRLNLILPEDRSYLGESLSNYRAKKIGLIAPDSHFVILRINGKYPSVYFETEGWRKEFLEANGLSAESVSLYGENDAFAFQGYNHDVFEDIKYWKKYKIDSNADIAPSLNDYSEIEKLCKLVYGSSDEEFNNKIADILDMDNFYKWQAHSMLMGSTHQDFIHNIRLIFDKTNGKFQFVPWDLRIFNRDSFTDLHYSGLVSRILKNSEFLNERNKVLWQYIKDDKNLNDDLNFYNQAYQDTKVAFYKDKIKNFSNLTFDQKVKSGRNMIIKQYNNIRKALKNSDVAVIVNLASDWVKIDITTSSFSDILIKSDDFGFYYDQNKNNIKDSNDVKLNNYFQMSSRREIPSGYVFEAEIKVLPSSYSFFISRKEFDSPQFKLNITNAITGDKIEPVVNYIN